MAKYLIDANLPYYFSLWHHEEYLHLKDIDDTWPDRQVWEFAKQNNLIIVTKDADFSNRIILLEPPPKVIHFKTGNMRLAEFHSFVNRVWPEAELLIETNKLLYIYNDYIEYIK